MNEFSHRTLMYNLLAKLSAQTVFRPSLGPEEAGYEGTVLQYEE